MADTAAAWPWRRSLPAMAEAGLAAAIALAIFAAGAGWTPLIGRDESRFAQAAREMLARRDLVVPTFAGAPRYDKPILIYWATMASYAVLGVDEGAARLPSHLAGAATVLLVAAAARRRFGPGAGLLAGLLLAGTVTFHLQARACTADMVMLAPTTAAMLALLRLAEGDGRRRVALVLWLGLALAALAKGPVGPAAALSTLGALWALRRSWRRAEIVVALLLLLAGWWRLGPVVLAVPVVAAGIAALRSPTGRTLLGRLRLAWGPALAVAVIAPWAIAAWVATGGDFVRVGVGRHVVERSLTALESHGGFPGFYLATAAVAAFPLAAFLPAAIRAAWAHRRTDRCLSVFLAWALGPLALLELVQTKLVHYWLPAYPAAVLLVVWWLWRARARPSGLDRWGRWLLGVGGAVVALAPVLVVEVVGLPGLRASAVGLAVVLGVGTAAAVIAAGTDRRRAAWVAAGAAATFMVLLGSVFLPALGPYLIGPRLAARALETRQGDERIVVYKAQDDELFFELPLDVTSCRPPECLVAEVAFRQPLLGLARTRDLESFRAAHPEASVVVVETVRGVELGRGRWTEAVLFRAGAGVATTPGMEAR